MVDISRTWVGFFKIDHHDPGALYPLTSGLIVSALLQAVLSYSGFFLVSFFLLQYLTIGLYGDLVFAQQVLNVACVVLTLGTRNTALKFMFQYVREGVHRYGHFFWWHIGLLVQSVMLFAMLFSVVMLTFVMLDYRDYVLLKNFHVAFWGLAGAPFYTLWLVLQIYFLVFGRALLYNFNTQLTTSLVWTALIFLWGAYFPEPDKTAVIWFIFAQALSLFLVVIVQWLVFLKPRWSELATFNESIRVESDWRDGLFCYLMIDCYSILPFAILLFCAEAFSPSEALVGDFSLCYTLSIVMPIVTQVVYPLVFGHVSHMIQTKNVAASGMNALIRAHRCVLSINIVILTVIFFLGDHILFYFGRHDGATHGLFILMSLAQFFRSFYFPLQSFAMVRSGLFRHAGLINLSEYLILLVAGPVIIYFYDGDGLIMLFLAISVIQWFHAVLRFQRHTHLILFRLW